MLKVIRRNVFETNSSSTHSISIYRSTPREDVSIPLNTEITIAGSICEQRIKDEMGKLRYIVVILASIYDYKHDYNKEQPTFEELTSEVQFKWLKDVVREQCNTYVIYQENRSCFPYFETTYDDSENIEDVLGCDINNEKQFKARVKEIIFGKDYVIEDGEDEY